MFPHFSDPILFRSSTTLSFLFIMDSKLSMDIFSLFINCISIQKGQEMNNILNAREIIFTQVIPIVNYVDYLSLYKGK